MKKSTQNYLVAGTFAATALSILLCPREEALSDLFIAGGLVCLGGSMVFGIIGSFRNSAEDIVELVKPKPEDQRYLPKVYPIKDKTVKPA